MGFLGDYKIIVTAQSPTDREIVFPKKIANQWIKKGLEFEEVQHDRDYYIGDIFTSISEEYYMFIVNDQSFTKQKKKLSLESLLSKKELSKLPLAVYAGDFYLRPHVFNSGWENTVNPIHLKSLNDSLLKYVSIDPLKLSKYKTLIQNAKRVNLLCELAIYFFVRPKVIAT